VTVSGVGTLGLPLMDVAVEALKAVATKAPFGLGSDTLHDESVRQAWQIDATMVTLEGGAVWDEYLQSVVVQSCQELGFSNERVAQLGIHATLYKLLLYETGGHFLAHRDSEKEEGMFGTLVIQLPSLFTGGAFTVSHLGETKTFVQERDSKSDFKYIAFYADCEHQLHPVTSGTRLCLVFNLVCFASETPTHAINIGTESKLQIMANDWMADKGALSELGYGLGHQYTPQSFGIDSLKGRDALVFQTLLNSKSMNGEPLFEVYLLLLERYHLSRECHVDKDVVSARLCLDRDGAHIKWNGAFYKDDSAGWMLCARDYYNKHKYWNDGDGDSDEDEDADGDKWEGLLELANQATFARAPDITNIKGYRGNDGGPEERWYYAAAIVISPTEKRVHS
jgi:2OG-Fe(II) oxygenase superfamily